METATVIHEGDCQTVRLPKGFHLSSPTVSVRYEGESIILEPLKPIAWPEGFFESIHITDPAFSRFDQGLGHLRTGSDGPIGVFDIMPPKELRSISAQSSSNNQDAKQT